MLDQLDRLFWNSASKLNLHTLIGEDEKEKKITRISRSTPDRREYKISSHSVKWERTAWFASEVIKLKFGFWPDHSSWFCRQNSLTNVKGSRQRIFEEIHSTAEMKCVQGLGNFYENEPKRGKRNYSGVESVSGPNVAPNWTNKSLKTRDGRRYSYDCAKFRVLVSELIITTLHIQQKKREVCVRNVTRGLRYNKLRGSAEEGNQRHAERLSVV